VSPSESGVVALEDSAGYCYPKSPGSRPFELVISHH